MVASWGPVRGRPTNEHQPPHHLHHHQDPEPNPHSDNGPGEQQQQQATHHPTSSVTSVLGCAQLESSLVQQLSCAPPFCLSSVSLSLSLTSRAAAVCVCRCLAAGLDNFESLLNYRSAIEYWTRAREIGHTGGGSKDIDNCVLELHQRFTMTSETPQSGQCPHRVAVRSPQDVGREELRPAIVRLAGIISSQYILYLRVYVQMPWRRRRQRRWVGLPRRADHHASFSSTA